MAERPSCESLPLASGPGAFQESDAMTRPSAASFSTSEGSAAKRRAFSIVRMAQMPPASRTPSTSSAVRAALTCGFLAN